LTPRQVIHILSQAESRWGKKYLVRIVCITGDGYFTVDGRYVNWEEGMICLDQEGILIFTDVEAISTIEVAEDEEEDTTTH
jgi:hypothetical protein